MKKRIKWVVAILSLTIVLLLPNLQIASCAAKDPMIIVSLGDSYSAGEGLTPYYGQNKPLKQKIKDRDWLAHRSTISWPARLQVPGFDGTMADYRQTGSSTAACQWYFAASGGALISDVYSTEQSVKASKVEHTILGDKNYAYKDNLPTQISVFDTIEGSVDYVTITIGGNDIGFGELIKTCTKHSTYLGNASINEKMEDKLDNIEALKTGLTEAYSAIAEAAGPQATVIVVGYPKILDEDGKGSLYSREEAVAANSCISRVNKEISSLVNSLSKEGMNICFVNVEKAFDTNGGHLAYSEDPWIGGILIGPQQEGLNDSTIVSGSSLHLNDKGSKAYSLLVNKKIRELEEAGKFGTVSGVVCTGYKDAVPIRDANIKVYDDAGKIVSKGKTDAEGGFSLSVEEGDYKVIVSATGYLNTSAYISVYRKSDIYMEPVMFKSEDAEVMGTVKGKITNASTGKPVAGASVVARKGFNNTLNGSLLARVKTDKDGNYEFSIPIGSYCITVTGSGYEANSLDLIVREGTLSKQNLTIKPAVKSNSNETEDEDE